MTATAIASPTRPVTTARPPSRRRRRILAVVVVVLFVMVAAAVLRPGEPTVHTGTSLEASGRGTYVLDDGRHLTLWDSAGLPPLRSRRPGHIPDGG